MVEIKDKFRRALKILLRFLFVLMVIFVLFIVIQLLRNPGQPPSLFSFQPFTVLSNSMNPTFETGDMVIVKRLEASEIQENDVITFKEAADKYITHRVSEVILQQGDIQFVTKGDNNNVVDETLVSAKNVIGKQVFMIPNVGFISKFISGPVGFFLLILLPFTGYICLEVYERSQKSAKRHPSKQNIKKI
ncbi:signal peptidase I [Virgibacillus salexigens]|uniref:signal peptidase I n=1 Tax=Virgibacillus TaxID=84406 RepID=UPI00136BB5F6|nr:MULTISPECIES: signal peptidase I [Virgibacillus]MYL41404.1 signal peptidase I [Virgibacillus massiliensis]